MPNPYWSGDGLTLYHGDCRSVLAEMPAHSVSTVVTSPPFYGLRKYDCPDSEWDNGWRGVFGNEPTVDCLGWATGEKCGQCYVCHTIEILRLLRRVLRKDGCLFWDLDDSRSTGAGGREAASQWANGWQRQSTLGRKAVKGFAPKNLLLIPQRVALAAQADGWIIRSDIKITSWMPESAKNRPTDAYRTLLMMTPSNTVQWYWNDKTRVTADRPPTERLEGRDWDYRHEKDGSIALNKKGEPIKDSHWHGEDYYYDSYAVRQQASESTGERYRYASAVEKPAPDAPHGDERWAGTTHGWLNDTNPNWNNTKERFDGNRNLSNVWSDIPPAAYPDSHFATYSVEEPLRCIQASTPEQVCNVCGKPRVRVVKGNKVADPRPESTKDRDVGSDYNMEGERWITTYESEGWSDCGHGDYSPGVVLDPFVGTGTTLIAARQLGRAGIGIDASDAYLRQAVRRLTLGDSAIRKQTEARRNGHEQASLFD